MNTQDRLDVLEALVAAQAIEIADLRNRIPVELIPGIFPPYAEISQMHCQIFHNPNLTAKERKTKSVWSPRFTIWQNNVRMKDEISVMLRTQYAFATSIRQRSNQVRPSLANMAETLLNNANINTDFKLLGSLMRARPKGGGRPYVCTQAVMLWDYDTQSPMVQLVIDSDTIEFKNFRPAAGTDPKSATWFGHWHKP